MMIKTDTFYFTNTYNQNNRWQFTRQSVIVTVIKPIAMILNNEQLLTMFHMLLLLQLTFFLFFYQTTITLYFTMYMTHDTSPAITFTWGKCLTNPYAHIASSVFWKLSNLFKRQFERKIRFILKLTILRALVKTFRALK